jgi:hypothetical protein
VAFDPSITTDEGTVVWQDQRDVRWLGAVLKPQWHPGYSRAVTQIHARFRILDDANDPVVLASHAL